MEGIAFLKALSRKSRLFLRSSLPPAYLVIPEAKGNSRRFFLRAWKPLLKVRVLVPSAVLGRVSDEEGFKGEHAPISFPGATVCMVLMRLGIASLSIEGQQLLQESGHSQMVLYVIIIMTTNKQKD